MKTTKLRLPLLLTLLACAGIALADGLTALQQLTKTNSDPSTPVRLTSVRGQSLFKTATFYGRLHPRTNNTSSVYLGPVSTNSTQPIEVPAGGSVVITAPKDSYLDLYDFYLDVSTANDGVVVVFQN